MTEAQKNYRELLLFVYDVYKNHTQMHLTDKGDALYFNAHDRYGGCSYIMLTEEQAVELARNVDDRLALARQNIEGHIEDYDHHKRLEAE